jgi:high-affinity nickel-transport protein
LVGGAICGAFLVFGGLSVLIYKPWRRRVDKRRLQAATFEPLSVRDDVIEEEELASRPVVTKTMGANVEPVETTGQAGPHTGR